MQPLFDWLEATDLARTVGQSVPLTAGFSAAHLIGFTLVMSGALAWNLRAAGVLLVQTPLPSIARSAMRLLAGGLALSLLTGLVLFAPRAAATAAGGTFQLKIALAITATVFQIALYRATLREPALRWPRAAGVTGIVLWLALAVTACWFILFE
jgi:hypothetical protein